jgi:hypothetical protein
MAVDVNKLIADAKQAQAAARTASQKEQAQAAKERVSAEVAARSKKEIEYANTLRPRLKDYEETLKITANKIARGDKLSAVEQKEFDRLVKEYKSLNKTIDSAIKRSNDILVEERRRIGGAPTPAPAPVGPVGPMATSPTRTPTPGVTPAATQAGTPAPPTEFVQRTPALGTGDKKPSGTPPKPKPGAKTPTPAPATKKALTIDEIIDAVANEYGSIDTIFKTDPGLQELLRKAIGKDGVPNTDDDLTVDQFTNELENTDWFKTNASSVRQRGFYKRQFDELVREGGNLEDLYKTTEYGRGLKFTQQVIADEIKKVGATLTPEEIDLISRDIYDLGYENQKAIVSQRIRAKIAYKPGGIVGGEAGENLADLRKTAKANGLDLEKNFGSSIQGWLQNLAQGESVETFKQIIRSTAKLGLPEKVSSLLDQGVDLDTIYNPYKRLMASVLEINPETINLDDQVLRSAIGPDKEMSLYDYQKMLRKDNRWQFTNQAKEEVSDTALRVLRDFGFQG